MRLTSTCLLTFLFSIQSFPTVFAQQPILGPTQVFSTRTESLEDDEEGKDEAIVLESEFTSTIELPDIVITPCQATISLAYYQKNTLAHVEIDIKYEACPVAKGNFEIGASVRNDNGESTSHNFSESWLQEGNFETSFIREYPIGSNVALSNVRSRRLQCECLGGGE